MWPVPCHAGRWEEPMRRRMSIALACAEALLLGMWVLPPCVARAETSYQEPALERSLGDEQADREEGPAPSDDTGVQEKAISSAASQGVRDEPAPEGEEQTLARKSVAADADAYAQAHEGTVPDGVYCITTALDTTYSLDVRGGSTRPGAQVILYRAKVSYNQRWEIRNVGGGYVLIKSVGSGRYLQVDAAKNGIKLVQGSDQDTGELNQRWIIAREDGGSFSIASALNKDYVFNVRHGAKALVNDNPIETIVYRRGSALARNELWNLQVTQDSLDEEAAKHAADLRDGLYLISKASDTSKVLDVRRASRSDGATILTYAKTPAINQTWQVRHDKKGYAIIASAWSGKVLDVRRGKAADGTSIIQWTEKTGARNQQWIIARRDDGSYTLTSALTGWRYVLDVSESVAVLREEQLRSTSGSSWTFEKAPEQLANYHAVEDGMYLIKTGLNETKGVNKTLDASARTKHVNLWEAKRTKNQLWSLTHDKQGYVHFTNMRDGLELGYAGGRTVETETSSRWIVKAAGNGMYTIAYDGTGKVLDVSDQSTANGAKVVIGQPTGATSQLWNLERDNGFTTINGKKYLLDGAGNKLVGIHEVNGQKFYFDSKQGGALATKGILLRGASRTVYVNPDTGNVVTGLPLDGSKYVVAWDGVLHEIPARTSESTTAYAAKVARIVADCVAPYSEAGSDLARVRSAAQYVYAFIGNKDMSRYTNNWNVDKQFAYAYGPLSFGRFSCAGCTEALKLILDDMGYSATHMNYQDKDPSLSHQYCSVTMDGKRGWADGEIGMASYGTDDSVHKKV